jgi:alcohol dehydrogenase (cytochrome c)
MRFAWRCVAAFIVLSAGGLGAAQEITFDLIREGLNNHARWLTYSGDYHGTRHSPLTQITAANVAEIAPQWTFQTAAPGKFEATPIVVDGVLYVSGPDNNAWAISARNGRTIWRYQRRTLPEGLSLCCGRVNRGLAVYRDKLFMVTLDAHLLALDMKSGAVVYDVAIDDYRKGYTGTVAPLVVKDKVIVGIAGAEYGIRGFIDAFDAETGRRAWRFWTVPGPGEPGHDTWSGESWKEGGATTWVTGSYDPDLNLLFWGTGNPSPDHYGDVRKGDNLYSASLVALDADTGTLKWHFQFTPHDTHDYDSTHVPVLADVDVAGRRRKLVMVANRNGFYYTFDRTNGAFLGATPFIRQTWARGIAPDGRPVRMPDIDPNDSGATVCPDALGGTNFMSPSFSPATGLFYVMARETCGTFFGWASERIEGQLYEGGAMNFPPGVVRFGAIRALDAATGERRWEFKLVSPAWGGLLSTASGLLFGGDQEGNIIALDAATGKHLWHYALGAPIYAAPTTVMVDGRQLVLMPSGTTLTAFALPARLLPSLTPSRR